MKRRKDLSLALQQKQKEKDFLARLPTEAKGKDLTLACGQARGKKALKTTKKKRGEDKAQKIRGKVFNGSGQDQPLGMVRI